MRQGTPLEISQNYCWLNYENLGVPPRGGHAFRLPLLVACHNGDYPFQNAPLPLPPHRCMSPAVPGCGPTSGDAHFEDSPRPSWTTHRLYERVVVRHAGTPAGAALAAVESDCLGLGSF